jgi:hypothetical protein
MKDYNYYFKVLSEVNLTEIQLSIYNQVLDELENYPDADKLIADLLASNTKNVNINLLYLFSHRKYTNRLYINKQQIQKFLESSDIDTIDTTLQYLETITDITILQLLNGIAFEHAYLNEIKNNILQNNNIWIS